VIARDDIDRARKSTHISPVDGSDLAVDTDALSDMAYAAAPDMLAVMVGAPVRMGIAAVWATGFMAGVRAAREDTL
jgi:hypothetical protein